MSMVNTVDMHHKQTIAGDGLRIVFAGGGSGGHLFPSLAIAEAIRNRQPAAQFCFLATTRAIDKTILECIDGQVVYQNIMPPTIRPWKWPRFALTWRSATSKARALFIAYRPDLVVGSGGFASVPAVWQAAAMEIPTAILNPDLLCGRANRLLTRRADVVFVQWAESQRYFPSHIDLYATGCPVRGDFGRVMRDESIRSFSLDPHLRTLLVTGASQGARSLNRAMIRLAEWLASLKGWQFLHITGSHDLEAVRRAYDAVNLRHKCIAFTQHMPEALSAADLVVSRAGASALAELAAGGKPSVLVPYPYDRKQHQLANARKVELGGAARICLDDRNGRRISDRLQSILDQLMHNDDELRQMTEAARGTGAGDAAERVAELCLQLAHGASADAGTRMQKNAAMGRYSTRAGRKLAGSPSPHFENVSGKTEIGS